MFSASIRSGNTQPEARVYQLNHPLKELNMSDYSQQINAHLPELLHEGERLLGYLECRGLTPTEHEGSSAGLRVLSIGAMFAAWFGLSFMTSGLIDLFDLSVMYPDVEGSALLITDQAFRPIFFEETTEADTRQLLITSHQAFHYHELSALKIKRSYAGGSIKFTHQGKRHNWSVIGRHFMFAQLLPFLQSIMENKNSASAK